MYIYIIYIIHNIYIYIYIYVVPERNEKNILSGILVILLVAITFSLANL